jgi:1-phosphofructokinase family hexose kinase
VGGVPGEAIQQDCHRLGLPARWIDTTAASRVCTTVIDTARQSVTELVPEAHALATAERDAFTAAFRDEAAQAEVVVAIGSLPPGTPADFYRELLRHARGKVVLDARGPELLTALDARPFLVKPNRDELRRTLDRDLRDESAVLAAMRELNQRGAAWVVITDGGNPVLVSAADRRYRLRPPAAEVVNPIGCGDCLAAGIAWATHHGREPLDAIRFGVAVAADKLGRVLPAELDPARIDPAAVRVEILG